MTLRTRLRLFQRTVRAALRDQRGAHAIEWALLLAAIAIPGFVIIRLSLETLLGHYQLVTTVNSLPFP